MPDQRLTRLAPAKVNLCLHVGPVDARGYHPLQTLVAFADIGDQVSLTDVPGLTISGPFAAGLSTGEDNLVMKAMRRFEASTGRRVEHGVHLDKQLPVASGIGGGSADAGAVLHLLRFALAPDISDSQLEAIASSLGADGAMCLWARSSLATGYGEILSPATLPKLHAVLVNPLVECSTALVYKGFDAILRQGVGRVLHAFDVKFDGFDAVVGGLSACRNDLQAPAITLQPKIAAILHDLTAQPQARLVRMSGSGATCFALCETRQDADELGRRMQQAWPAAWVRSCQLG